MVDPELQQSVNIYIQISAITACNPVVYVNSFDKKQNQWVELYKTQGGRIDSNFDLEPIPMIYNFEKQMKLQVRIFNLLDMS